MNFNELAKAMGRAARKNRIALVKNLKNKMSNEQWIKMNKCNPIKVM